MTQVMMTSVSVMKSHDITRCHGVMMTSISVRKSHDDFNHAVLLRVIMILFRVRQSHDEAVIKSQHDLKWCHKKRHRHNDFIKTDTE